MRIAMAMIAAFALLAGVAAAQPAPPDAENGRYILRSLDDGFIRVDRETGATSVCREDADGWACRAVPDEREALEDEIARLAQENVELAARVGELEEELAAAEGRPLAPRNDEERMLDLPSEAEIDRVMESFERMMRRFLGIVRSLKEDLDAERR